jgi:hypothetical protein
MLPNPYARTIMIYTYTKTIATWLCRFWYVQCFLSLFSLPILIAWGLPLSLASPFGNLIFSPIITIFLILSCILFFCELLSIPNALIMYALEFVSQWWLFLLEYAQQEWCIGFVRVPTLFLWMLPVAALVCVMYTIQYPLWKRALSITALLFFCLVSLRLSTQHSSLIHSIACNSGSLTLLMQHNQLIMIDPGYISKRQANSWVMYTLVPEIIRTTGRTTIDHLVILSSNPSALQAIIKLCEKMRIHTLYIPAYGMQESKELLHELSRKVTQLIIFDTHSQELLQYNDEYKATIEPVGIMKRSSPSKKLRYVFKTTIDNRPYTIYSARYTKSNKDISNSIAISQPMKA